MSFGAEIEKEFEKLIEFTEDGKINLKNVNGNIDVISWDRTEVEVKALIKVKAAYMDDAEDFIKEVEIIIHESYSRIEIEIKHPEKNSYIKGLFSDWKRLNLAVNFRIKVPKLSDLDINGRNGNIFTRWMDHKTRMTTQSFL